MFENKVVSGNKTANINTRLYLFLFGGVGEGKLLPRCDIGIPSGILDRQEPYPRPGSHQKLRILTSRLCKSMGVDARSFGGCY
jgi:hypothetical protein